MFSSLFYINYCFFVLSFRKYPLLNWLFRSKETILDKSFQLCEDSNKLTPKQNFFHSNVEATLTHWSLNKTFLMLYIRDFATFRLINCQNYVSLMSYILFFTFEKQQIYLLRHGYLYGVTYGQNSCRTCLLNLLCFNIGNFPFNNFLYHYTFI